MERVAKSEEEYERWRGGIVEARQSLKPEFTPRGNSLAIGASGITARGAGSHTPRGFSAIASLAAGSNHVALVHQSGADIKMDRRLSARLRRVVSNVPYLNMIYISPERSRRGARTDRRLSGR